MRALIVTCMLLLASSIATAQPESGDLGIFADPEGTLTTDTAEPFVVGRFYIVTFDLPGGMLRYEFSYSGLRENGGVLLNSRIIGSPHPLCEFDTDEYICTTGRCIEDQGPLVVYEATYLFLESVPADTAICAGGTIPSSFESGRPGWLDCAGSIREFGVATDGGEHYPDGCLILNPTQSPPVAIDVSSYGELKARF